MVGTYTPSIAPLEAPVSDCGMGLGGVEASTAGRNEVWRRGEVGGRYSALPIQGLKTYGLAVFEREKP